MHLMYGSPRGDALLLLSPRALFLNLIIPVCGTLDKTHLIESAGIGTINQNQSEIKNKERKKETEEGAAGGVGVARSIVREADKLLN